MVIAGVLTLPQMYRGIDWSTCVLIGAMIPPATAMTKTGAAAMIGDYVVNALGGAGPLVVLAGIFLATATISQFISNTSAALVMMPISLATASELGVSALPMMMGVAMGASASFLTPYANGVSMMVHGPGGYTASATTGSSASLSWPGLCLSRWSPFRSTGILMNLPRCAACLITEAPELRNTDSDLWGDRQPFGPVALLASSSLMVCSLWSSERRQSRTSVPGEENDPRSR